MDYGRLAELTLRVQHRHSDGTWGALEPVPSHHDPADHDPERDWRLRDDLPLQDLRRGGPRPTLDDPGDPRS